MHPNRLDDLHAEIVDDVVAELPARLAPKTGGPPGAALPVALGFPELSGAVGPLVRSGLDMAVMFLGPVVGAAFKANKDAIRQAVSERTLEFMEGLLHDLEDARAGGGGA